jgi:hypothetical protein
MHDPGWPAAHTVGHPGGTARVALTTSRASLGEFHRQRDRPAARSQKEQK